MSRHTPAARLRGPGNEPVGGGSSVNPFETFTSSTGVGVSVADGVTLNNPVANLRGPGNDPVETAPTSDATGTGPGGSPADNLRGGPENEPVDPTQILVETGSGGEATVEQAKKLGLGPFASAAGDETGSTGPGQSGSRVTGTTSMMPATSGGASFPGGGLLVALLVGLAVLFSGVLS